VTDASYERAQAERCRRLARSAEKEVAADFLKLAEKYEEHAGLIEAGPG
jgi:hypothetical protein